MQIWDELRYHSLVWIQTVSWDQGFHAARYLVMFIILPSLFS